MSAEGVPVVAWLLDAWSSSVGGVAASRSERQPVAWPCVRGQPPPQIFSACWNAGDWGLMPPEPALLLWVMPPLENFGSG